MYGATFDVLFDQESIKWFTGQKDLKGRKARWAEILQEFDCNLRYRKGRYNVVADALSRMPEVETLSFTKIKSTLLDSLRGQYEHDQSYKDVWNTVEGIPHQRIVHSQLQTMQLPHRHLRLRAMRCSDGKFFPLIRACYSTKVECVCPRTMTLGAKLCMNVMTVQVLVILWNKEDLCISSQTLLLASNA